MKPFAWSFSKLKNFETCPKKHYEVDLQRNYQEESTHLTWGNEVHKALENAVKKISPLPIEMKSYSKYVQSVLNAHGKVEVEKQYALDRNFVPVSWFDKQAWYRGKADVVLINGENALAIDWKTGKVSKDSVQLMLMAQCIFAHNPQVKRVRTMYVWLQFPDAEPVIEDYDRQEVANAWIGLLLRVKLMEEAYNTQTYPPKPSGLCRKHCPVVSCPHHGKGARG